MNFPNLAIVPTSISRRPIDTLKLSLRSKTPLFQVSCKNRGKSPLHCGLRKWRFDSYLHKGSPTEPLEYKSCYSGSKLCLGRTCYPRNKIMRLLFPKAETFWHMTAGLQGPPTTSSSLLCFSGLSSSPVAPCASAQPSPPSSLGTVRLLGTGFNDSTTLSAAEHLVRSKETSLWTAHIHLFLSHPLFLPWSLLWSRSDMMSHQGKAFSH